MASIPLSAVSAALAAAAALQIPFLLLRRSMPRPLDRLRYELWVAAVAGSSFFLFAGIELGASLGFRILVFAASVLTLELTYRALDQLLLARLTTATGRPLVPQLVRDLLFWVVIGAALVAVGTKVFDWHLERWALPSAVISAVLGFALQDVLKNVFAGLSLQTQAAFDLGDWLLVDGEPRQVLQMNWRATHLRNNLSIDFHEPNANLANREIRNLGSGKKPMGFEVEVGVVYGAPPAVVKRSLERAAASSAFVVADPRPAGLLVGFGESAVSYRLRFWTRDVHAVARVLDEVRSRIWYGLQRDGLAIPFPMRSVEIQPVGEQRAERVERDRERAAGLLASSDLFSHLDPEARDQLARAARRMHFDARERLVVEGAAGDSMMLLASGVVAISKSGTEIGAGTVSLAELREGSYFGEMSLLTGAPRSATVTATEPVEIFVLDREAVAPILERDPEIAETLSHVLAERTAATQARFDDRKEELARLLDTNRQSILTRIRGFFGLGSG